MRKKSIQKRSCDRCGEDFRKSLLRRQQGLLVCAGCYDIFGQKPKYPKWKSERANSATVTAITSPTVFGVTGDGILALQRSQVFAQEGSRADYLMHIIGSGGAIVVTADPQIVAGADKNILTLRGTSDVYTVTFSHGRGLNLAGGISCQLGLGDVLTLVYVAASSVWVETSRDSGVV